MNRAPEFLLPVLLGMSLLQPTALASEARSRGEQSFRAGDLDAAAAELQRAIKATPDDAAAHHLLGAVYGRQAATAGMLGQLRTAPKIREHFERAVSLAPDELDYRESLMQYYLQAPAAVGGGIDKARGEAAEIARRDALRGRLARATIARKEGQADRALAEFRAVHQARPDDLRIAMRLVLYLQELKRWDEAFAQLDDMLARDRSSMAAWYQVGRTAVLANARHAEGEAALRHFIAGQRQQDDPPLSAAHWRLGMLYEQLGRKQDARRAYQEALRLDPRHPEAAAALKKLG